MNRRRNTLRVTFLTVLTACALTLACGGGGGGGVIPGGQGPDLSVTKSDAGVTVDPGDTITYALVYTNRGTDALTGVTLTETVPAKHHVRPR